MSFSGSEERFDAGSTIYFEDDPLVGVYFILSGVVALSDRDEELKPRISWIAASGDLLGMPEILDGDRYPNRALAVTDVTARSIPRTLFLESFLGCPSFREEVLDRLCERIETLLRMTSVEV